MKVGKLLLVGALLTMMIVPQVAWASTSPAQNQTDGTSATLTHSEGAVTLGNTQDQRGRVSWFGDGSWFWYQFDAFMRYLHRWYT